MFWQSCLKIFYNVTCNCCGDIHFKIFFECDKTFGNIHTAAAELCQQFLLLGLLLHFVCFCILTNICASWCYFFFLKNQSAHIALLELRDYGMFFGTSILSQKTIVCSMNCTVCCSFLS
ncbi:hypothetical protein MRX96_021056 [Rhipicephalus microplus]